MNPAVSVIVPIYNAELRLRACLDSLLAQTFRDWELILVNDGSTDASLAICSEFQAAEPERIRIFTGPNGGVSVARNRGLDAARGTWVVFCDADDVAAQDWLAVLHGNAVRDKADLSFCAFRDVGPESTKTVTNFPFRGSALLSGRKAILETLFLPLMHDAKDVHGYLFSCLFRRDVIERGHARFTPGIAMLEDELFLLKCLLNAETVTATDLVLYDYLRFDQSACSKFYRGRSAFYRESNWFLRAKERLRIYYAAGLDKELPEELPGLLLRKHLHEAQMICCDPDLGLLERFKRLRECAREAGLESAPETRTEGRVFWFFLLRCRILLPLLCLLKRAKDAFVRRLEHAAKRKGGRK